jgi:hypothetical protein
MQETERSNETKGFAEWIKRFGAAGFLFLFIKALLRLIVPALMLISLYKNHSNSLLIASVFPPALLHRHPKF